MAEGSEVRPDLVGSEIIESRIQNIGNKKATLFNFLTFYILHSISMF
jgi:hypothetical protein